MKRTRIDSSTVRAGASKAQGYGFESHSVHQTKETVCRTLMN
jgi:hypothetical protein